MTITLSYLLGHLHGQIFELLAVGILISIYKSLVGDTHRANVHLPHSHISTHCNMRRKGSEYESDCIIYSVYVCMYAQLGPAIFGQ